MTNLTKYSQTGQWLASMEADLDELVKFTPTESQQLAKAKFWKAVADNILMTTDITDLTLDALATMSGQRSFHKWIDKNPMFLVWFCDKDFEDAKVQMWAQKAINKLVEIVDAPLEEKLLTSKDQINAANLLLQLADKFPNKRRELVYLDKDLGRMGAEDVDRESKRIDKLLSAGKSDVDNET